MYDIVELNGKLVSELREIAKSLEIPKYEKLLKQDLIYKILDHQALNPPQDILDKEQDELFDTLHSVSWENEQQITKRFSITKRRQFFKDLDEVDKYDLIYFDAFGPRVQPELWTEEIFRIMYKALKLGGILVTYSAKGSVRRAMLSVGFLVERLPGPPGKREMLRATKHSAFPAE